MRDDRGDRAHRAWTGAIVGVGGVAQGSHLPAFRDPTVASRLALRCAVDPSPAAVARAGGLTVVPDVGRLAEFPELDFIDIATPSATHPALARWALEHGLHVLCEKPVAARRDEALALVALADERQRVLVPCHQYRFNPVWQRVREWIAGGALGRWHLAEIGVYRTAADLGAGAEDGPWRARASDGGGVLVDHGTHLLYTLLDIGGTPARVQAWTGRLLHHDYEAEDTAQVRLDFDAARAATLFVTWAARRRETRVHVVGDRGAITWVDGALTLERDGGAATYDFSRALDKSAYASWFAELFAGFADTLDEGADGALARRAHADVVRVATVLEAAFDSARTGAAVDVPPADAADVPSLARVG